MAGLAKIFLTVGCSSVEVTGLENLFKVLHDNKRKQEGRGLVTFANHISV